MNFNLFIPMDKQPDAEDAQRLADCNRVARVWRHRKLFYALKNQILFSFGVRDGYDLQTWDDEDFDYPDEAHATHNHILERFILCDRLFHKPTNEFYYVQWTGYGATRSSARYSEFRSLAKNTIKGKKEFCFEREAREIAWKSLKQLVKKYRYLLRWKHLHEHPMYLRV